MKIPSVRFGFLFAGKLITLLENYGIAKFHEILTSSSLENSSFPLKQPVTIFLSNVHAWLLIEFIVKACKRLSSS